MKSDGNQIAQVLDSESTKEHRGFELDAATCYDLLSACFSSTSF